MSNEALTAVKQSESALRQAYTDAGGQIGDGGNHNTCPICGDDSAFMLGKGENGFAVWRCWAGKGKCAAPAGRAVSGTIVDFIMIWKGLEVGAACTLAVERYGQPGAKAALAAPPKEKKQGRLWGDVVQALDAAKYGIEHRPRVIGVELKTFAAGEIAPNSRQINWFEYRGADGEPKIIVARFNVKKKTADGAEKDGKEFSPIHRDGNGWRVGLGGWGKAAKLCPLYELPKLLRALTKGETK